jgi:tRNA pseudouridine55 synthase
MPQVDGVLVLNKPSGPSSNQCLNKIKRVTGQKKVGHAGTLDPLAQGVLLVLFGQGTKLSSYLMGQKTYRGVLRLGETTDTWDSQGRVVDTKPWEDISEDAVKAAILDWKNLQEQEVPPYSAAKHEGQPLYKLSRQGRETPVKIKRIEIFSVEFISVEMPCANFRVTCSSGTYIRFLAHSLGMRLGCGAVLTELTREYSHPFTLDEAVTLEAVGEAAEDLRHMVMPLERALPHWPRVVLEEAEEAAVRNGMPLPMTEADLADASFSEGRQAILFSANGVPLALAESRLKDHRFVWVVLRGLWN